jgi:hypothetical protein
MAILPDADRALVDQAFQSDLSSARTPCTLSKAELRAAINAIDQWADDNASEFNQAIPLPARTALTGKQKAELLFRVVRRRFEVA